MAAVRPKPGYWFSLLERDTDEFVEVDDEDIIEVPDANWADVTAIHPGEAGRAQFQFVQESDADDSDECYVAGTVIADS